MSFLNIVNFSLETQKNKITEQSTWFAIGIGVHCGQWGKGGGTLQDLYYCGRHHSLSNMDCPLHVYHERGHKRCRVCLLRIEVIIAGNYNLQYLPFSPLPSYLCGLTSNHSPPGSLLHSQWPLSQFLRSTLALGRCDQWFFGSQCPFFRSLSLPSYFLLVLF